MKLDWTHSADEFDALLARWRGARAEAWHYHASHGVLYLALHCPPAVAYLQFKDCQSIHLYRTYWEPADLGVSRISHRLGTLHTIIDPGNFHLVVGQRSEQSRHAVSVCPNSPATPNHALQRTEAGGGAGSVFLSLFASLCC